MTRIAVFAYSETGHACLKLLFDRGENVVLVATHADDPAAGDWFDQQALQLVQLASPPLPGA